MVSEDFRRRRQFERPKVIADTLGGAGLSADWVSLIKAPNMEAARKMLGDELYERYREQVRSAWRRKQFDDFLKTLDVLQDSDVPSVLANDTQLQEFLKPSTNEDAFVRLQEERRRRKLLLHLRIQDLSKASKIESEAKLRARSIDAELAKLVSRTKAKLKPEGYNEVAILSEINAKGQEKQHILDDAKEQADVIRQQGEGRLAEVSAISAGLQELLEAAYEQSVANKDGRITEKQISQCRLADITTREKNPSRLLDLYKRQYQTGVMTMLDYRLRLFQEAKRDVKVIFEESFSGTFRELEDVWKKGRGEGERTEQRLSEFGGVIAEYGKALDKRMNDILLTCPDASSPEKVFEYVKDTAQKVATMTAMFFNNPYIEDINQIGKRQLIHEVISHVIFPHYELDMIVGFGGSRDDVNIRVPAYVIPQLMIVRECLQRGIRPPHVRILNAYALAVEINRMPKRETEGVAVQTDTVLHKFIERFFPECAAFVDSQIPTLGELQDGTVSQDAQRIAEYYRKLSAEFNDYPSDGEEKDKVGWVKRKTDKMKKEERETWTQRFNVWRSLEGLLERGRVRFREALRVAGRKEEITDEQMDVIKSRSFTYIAAHPWAFDNFVSMIPASYNRVPNGTIKFGGHGEVNFNYLQEYLVTIHRTDNDYDVLFMPTNTSGMRGVPDARVRDDIDPSSGDLRETIDLPAAPINITMASEHPPYYKAGEHEISMRSVAGATPEALYDAYFERSADGVRRKPGAPDVEVIASQVPWDEYVTFCAEMASSGIVKK